MRPTVRYHKPYNLPAHPCPVKIGRLIIEVRPHTHNQIREAALRQNTSMEEFIRRAAKEAARIELEKKT